MDKSGDLHVFGKNNLKPQAVYNLIAATLEISRISEHTLKNFPKAKKELTNTGNLLILVAKDLGISEELYRQTCKTILAANKMKEGKIETGSKVTNIKTKQLQKQ